MSGPPGWVADGSIGWRILLSAELDEPAGAAGLLARLIRLHDLQGWGRPAPTMTDPDSGRLRQLLTVDRPDPVVVGTSGSTVVISAHHGAADGLGLLRILTELTGVTATSSAAGVGDRPDTGSALRTTARRLAEVAAHPPARVRPRSPRPPRAIAGRRALDVMVEQTVPGRWRTHDLVDAAARAIVAHEASAGRTAQRVAVAVGAGRAQAPDESIADRSVLLRLQDVERMSRSEIVERLRTAPVQTPPAGGALSPVTAVGLRVLSPRLGSTVLVSHLGEVTTDPAVRDLAFHPVTAGGSGLSLGAVGLPGDDLDHSPAGSRTTLTLRARGDRWRAADLSGLLDRIAANL